MNEFISTINHFEYVDFRNRCMKECRISRTAWSKWINGGDMASKYKEDIDRIAVEMFGRPVFGEKGGDQ